MYAARRRIKAANPRTTQSSVKYAGARTTPGKTVAAARALRPRPARPMTAPKAPRGRSLSRGAKVVVLHERVLLELGDRSAFEHDLAVHDDVAAVGDADRLVEILLGHQHCEPVAFLQLPDLGDGMRDQDRREPHRGLVHQQEPGRGHQRAADRQHLLLAAGERAGELAPALRQDGKNLERKGKIPADVGARRLATGAAPRAPWRRPG